MSETTQQPEPRAGAVRKRGRPPKANGTDKPKRIRRTKAQIEAASDAAAAKAAAFLAANKRPMTAGEVVALGAAGASSVSIFKGDAATNFAADVIVQLVGKEPWVRSRAAQIIGAVCGELLKVA